MVEEQRRCGMGDGLHFPFVQAQRLFEELFAIAGGAGICNLEVRGHELLQLCHGLDDRIERAAHIALIEGPEQVAMGVDERQFGGGGTGIDAQIALAAGCSQIRPLDLVEGVALHKLIVFGFVLEQWRQTLDLRLQMDALLQLFTEFIQREGSHLLRQVGCGILHTAHGGKQMGILRHNGLFRGELQGAHKGLLQLRHKVERSAQEGHIAPDGTALCQTADGLVHHRLEDGHCQVLLGCALVDQGLQVTLGKNTAPGGNGIDPLVVSGIFIETFGIGAQQRCHLVDEGTGAAGTDAVHALVPSAGEIEDLGILTAQLDGYVGLGIPAVQALAHGDDFLDKGDLHGLGQRHTAAAGDGRQYRYASQLLGSPAQYLGQCLLNAGKMTAVFAVQNLADLVHNGDLDGGGTHVNAQQIILFVHSLHLFLV